MALYLPIQKTLTHKSPSGRQNTCAYTSFFVLFWIPAFLAIPVSIVLLGLGIYWVDRGEEDRYIPAFCIAAVLLVYTTIVRLHGPRVRIRAGTFPASWVGDYTPTTEADLLEAVAKIVTTYGTPPTVVGSGWGFFLKHEGAKGRRIFLHRFKGRQPMDRSRWRTGTTIAEVARTLLKEDAMTFPSHPTMDYISIGAWFAYGNHGNGGDLNSGSSKCLENARVLDMRTGIIETLEYPEIRRRFDGVNNAVGSNYLILDVEFKNLISNADVQKRGLIIDSPETASEWLKPGAYLRVCFQGAARNYAIGLRCEEIYDPTTKHRDPHLCSRVCTYVQVDIFSVVLGWHEPMKKYTGIVDRYNANRWMPTVWPLATIGVLLSGIRNFELVFLIGKPLDGNTMFKLILEMQKIHAVVGGRSEIRYGKARASTPVFLDCAVRHGAEKIFSMLRSVFGITETALHPGKHTHLSTEPLRRVPLCDVYGMSVPRV